MPHCLRLFIAALLLARVVHAETPEEWVAKIEERSRSCELRLATADEEALLAPFRSATTEQARIAIPLLIELVSDPDGSRPGEQSYMASEALFAMTWTRVIRVKAPSAGCMDAETHDFLSDIGKPGGNPEPVPPTPAEWWKANQSKEVADWRASGVAALLNAFRSRAAHKWPAIHALQDLVALGTPAQELVGEKGFEDIRKAALSNEEGSQLRSPAIDCLVALGDPWAGDTAEKMAVDTAGPWHNRLVGIWALQKIGKSALPRLVRIARVLGVEPGVLPERGSGCIWQSAMSSIKQLAAFADPDGTPIPGTVEERTKALRALVEKLGPMLEEPKKD